MVVVWAYLEKGYGEVMDIGIGQSAQLITVNGLRSLFMISTMIGFVS